jgi:ABC-type nickel/cobalt efflux system permease component RcnA
LRSVSEEDIAFLTNTDVWVFAILSIDKGFRMSKGINQSLAWVIALITAIIIFLTGAFVIYRTNIKTGIERSNQVDRMTDAAKDERVKSHEKAASASHGDKESMNHEDAVSGSHGPKSKDASSSKDSESLDKPDSMKSDHGKPHGKPQSEEHGDERSNGHSESQFDSTLKSVDNSFEKKNPSVIRSGAIMA